MRKEIQVKYDATEIIDGGFQDCEVLQWFAPDERHRKPTAIVVLTESGILPKGTILHASLDRLIGLVWDVEDSGL